MAITILTNSVGAGDLLIEDFEYQDDIEGNITLVGTLPVKSVATGHDGLLECIQSTLVLGTSITASYPSFPDNAKLISRSIRPLGGSQTGKWSMRLVYGPVKNTNAAESGAVVTFGGALSGKTTNIDKNGNLIYVGTLTTSEPTPTAGPYTAVPKTIVEVEKQTPAFTITASTLYATTAPDIYSLMGKLNGASLKIGPKIFDAKTVMMVDAKVTTPDRGLTWQADFTFQYRPDPNDWTQIVVAYDPKTGKPYQNITEVVAVGATGTAGVIDGAKRYDIYSTADFSPLDLGNP